jgi:hypothetical protein
MALSGYGPHAGKEISKAGTQEKEIFNQLSP